MTSISGVHSLCRVCAKPFENCVMVRMFNERNKPLPLAEAFWRVSEIDIHAEDSRFPQSCCATCQDRLQEVEDLRALCLESDRKLRKMIGIGLKEEEEGEDIGMSNVTAVPKVEVQEVPESYSCWEVMENRFNSCEEESDTEESPEKSRKTRTKEQKLEERTDDAAKIGAFPDADFEPNAAEDKSKTFRCEKCTRTFESKTAYERHMNSHEGIKLNQCSHCGKNYEFKAYLLQHIAEKHPDTVENLSRCQFCGVGYSTDGYYRKHIVKRHPEHLEAFDQWMKAKREAILAETQAAATSGQDHDQVHDTSGPLA